MDGKVLVGATEKLPTLSNKLKSIDAMITQTQASVGSLKLTEAILILSQVKLDLNEVIKHANELEK